MPVEVEPAIWWPGWNRDGKFVGHVRALQKKNGVIRQLRTGASSGGAGDLRASVAHESGFCLRASSPRLLDRARSGWTSPRFGRLGRDGVQRPLPMPERPETGLVEQAGLLDLSRGGLQQTFKLIGGESWSTPLATFWSSAADLIGRR